MANYRSLIGGYFSATPSDKSIPVSIRMNNPGAVNGAGWERAYPGYVAEIETTIGNRSTIFEAPEYGVAVWLELMKKYAAAGADTVETIILRYGGSGQQETYSNYAATVATRLGVSRSTPIPLSGNDPLLLKFAKEMFKYESGKQVLPWSDEQILYGFNFARTYAATGKEPAEPGKHPSPSLTTEKTGGVFVSLALALLSWLFGSSNLKFTRILREGDQGTDVTALQKRLIALGFSDLKPDGDFLETTTTAVKEFQRRQNLDPDGEVGEKTINALNGAQARHSQPPLLPPSKAKFGEPPPWYKTAEKWIGFHETGNNQGIEEFIRGGKCGSLGDPYCAIFANFTLETNSIPGTRSAMARSFESSSNFIKLDGPALGAICPMWRNSKASGQGHVYLYDGTSAKGIRGIGANEDDQIKRSFHDPSRSTGYYWPKGYPLPKIGAIPVAADGSMAGSEV